MAPRMMTAPVTKVTSAGSWVAAPYMYWYATADKDETNWMSYPVLAVEANPATLIRRMLNDSTLRRCTVFACPFYFPPGAMLGLVDWKLHFFEFDVTRARSGVDRKYEAFIKMCQQGQARQTSKLHCLQRTFNAYVKALSK